MEAFEHRKRLTNKTRLGSGSSGGWLIPWKIMRAS
jgi:hypothetical protein